MRGKNDYFDRLYTDWWVRLIKYAYRLTFDKSLAEEIVQETFIEAYKKSEMLQRHENPVGWLYVTTRNIAMACLRKIEKRKSEIHLKENVRDLVTYEDNTIYYVSDCLSKDETDLIIRFYKHRQSIEEIAKAYGISLSACKMRLKRTRDKLRSKYKNNFFDM